MHMVNAKGEAVYYNYVTKNDKDQYIGEGDIICDNGPGAPVLVVDGWGPTENYLRCCNKGSRNE